MDTIHLRSEKSLNQIALILLAPYTVPLITRTGCLLKQMAVYLGAHHKVGPAVRGTVKHGPTQANIDM